VKMRSVGGLRNVVSLLPGTRRAAQFCLETGVNGATRITNMRDHRRHFHSISSLMENSEGRGSGSDRTRGLRRIWR